MARALSAVIKRRGSRSVVAVPLPPWLVMPGVCHRKSSYKSQPWHVADFDSDVEVLLWRLDESDVVPYGDDYMLKLGSLLGRKRGVGAPAAADAQVETRWPAFFMLMTATQDDDGRPRQTCTITIVCEDGKWKGGLRDKDAQASVWRTGSTLEGLLTSLDEALTSGEAEWRGNEKNSRK